MRAGTAERTASAQRIEETISAVAHFAPDLVKPKQGMFRMILFIFFFAYHNDL
jgi:hypothetical protein